MHTAPFRKARPPAATALHLAAGLPAAALPILVMLPWLAANGRASAAVVAALALARGPRALLRAVGDAGGAVLKR